MRRKTVDHMSSNRENSRSRYRSYWPFPKDIHRCKNRYRLLVSYRYNEYRLYSFQCKTYSLYHKLRDFSANVIVLYCQSRKHTLTCTVDVSTSGKQVMTFSTLLHTCSRLQKMTFLAALAGHGGVVRSRRE